MWGRLLSIGQVSQSNFLGLDASRETGEMPCKGTGDASKQVEESFESDTLTQGVLTPQSLINLTQLLVLQVLGRIRGLEQICS